MALMNPMSGWPESRGVQPLVARRGRIEMALHEVDRPHLSFVGELDAFAGAREPAQLVFPGAFLHARQRQVRTKRAPFHFESDRLTRHLDVVVQQFESRVALDTHPYDAGSAKVRECSDFSDADAERPMP